MEQFLFLFLLIAIMWFIINAGCEMVGCRGLPGKVIKFFWKPLRKYGGKALRSMGKSHWGILKRAWKKIFT